MSSGFPVSWKPGYTQSKGYSEKSPGIDRTKQPPPNRPVPDVPSYYNEGLTANKPR